MSVGDLISFGVFILALVAGAPVMGRYLAKVYSYGPGEGPRIFVLAERIIYRTSKIDERSEQTWRSYATSMVVFAGISTLGLYAILRIQGIFFGNPLHLAGVNPVLALNTAVSFVTNTNWQNYGGESTMTFVTQALGLTVENFISAAVGIAAAIALVRSLVRTRSSTIGNFWVDVTRTIVRVLLPFSFIFMVVLVSQGVLQNLNGERCYQTVTNSHQCIVGGLVASQEAIKELGTNGGGFYNANSAYPFENPNAITNALETYSLLLIPFSLPFAFGRLLGNKRQGYALVGAMFALWLGSSVSLMYFQSRPAPVNNAVHAVAVGKSASIKNAEGVDLRFGGAACALFSASTTGTSTGSVNCALDSLTPAAGGVALVNIMLGEVDPGGTGSGLYGILIFAILTVFITGLMVGRTPEYLGKKIQANEMKLITLYLLILPLSILTFSALSVIIPQAKAATGNPGPHGLTEIVYSYVSTGNNNGSAFAGLSSNTRWYNITQAINMAIGRFGLIIPELALAGSLARKRKIISSAGTFPTDSVLFVGILIAVIILVVGLTYFPVLALGPVVEQLAGHF